VLAPALKSAGALTRNRSPLAILSTVMIELTPGGCSLTASNNESWFTATCEADINMTWAACVDARQCSAFLESLPKGSAVELSAGDKNDWLTLTGSGARVRLALLPAGDFPILKPPAATETVDVPLSGTVLATALRFCVPAAAVDGGRDYLRGVHFDPEGLAVATDGHRLAVHRPIANPPAFSGAIVPLPAVRLMATLMRGFAEDLVVRLSPRLIAITTPSWALTSRLIDGTFPDWRSSGAAPCRDADCRRARSAGRCDPTDHRGVSRRPVRGAAAA
jgi:DNA polymerase-3 subunit beta